MTRLPDAGERIETGVVQFGDDWPGVFVRGDRCVDLVEVLKGALDQMAMPDNIQEYKLNEYIELFRKVTI